MNKVLRLALALVMAFTLAACSNNDNDEVITNEGAVSNNSSNEPVGTTVESIDENRQNVAEDVRIKLSFNNDEVIVNMYDNPTSRDLLERLPLTLTFEEFGGFEKLGVLEESLSTADAPSGSTPSVGDFAYFSPWENITVFYEDWRYSVGLVKLGKIDSGAEKFASISDDFIVTVEKVD